MIHQPTRDETPHLVHPGPGLGRILTGTGTRLNPPGHSGAVEGLQESSPGMVVLSHYQIGPLLRARKEGRGTARTSLDLGLSHATVELDADGVYLSHDEHLPWDELERIGKSRNGCFQVVENRAERIQRFSESRGRVYSLMPTPSAPTLLLSGFAMHRIKAIDPHQDTGLKIAAITPVEGRVLDTTTGLGYTAIEAAKTADQVWTLEKDPTVLAMAHLNPWSQSLFQNPRIRHSVVDAAVEVRQLDRGTFSRILHDPPTMPLAGELYAETFYHELFRLLAPRGRLFHYIGNLQRPSGRRVVRGVVRRLQRVGFTQVVEDQSAFGLVAYKGRSSGREQG